MKNTAKTYVDESKSTVDQIQKTVKKKSQEVKDTVGSLQDAYTAFDKAKGDLEKLTVFSTGSTNTGR